MMIMKFHRLIQSRLMWMFFLGIVVVSFVFWGAFETMSESRGAASLNEPVAHLHGKPVTLREFSMTQRQIERSAETHLTSDELEELAYSRIAMIDFARRVGLRVPRLVAQQAYNQMLTGEDGEIDQEFRAMVLQSIRQDFMTESDIVNQIRDDMLLEELQRFLTAFEFHTDFEARRWARIQTDEFTLVHAALTPGLLEDPVEPTEEDVLAYFEENQDDFTISERRQVRFVRFALEDFKQEDDVMDETAAREFYERNPQRFTRFEPTTTEDGGMTFEQRLADFEEVKEEIMESHRAGIARGRAREEALAFAVRLTPRRGRPAPPLEEAAEERGLEVVTSSFFARNQRVPEAGNVPDFAERAFELDETPVGRTSQAVDGRDHVYILQLHEIEPARTPELGEVREAVEIRARERLTTRALESLGKTLREELQSEVEAGIPFKEAAQARGLEPEEAPPYQLATLDMRTAMISPDLADAATGHVSGDVFGPVWDERFGEWRVGYVVERAARPEEAVDTARELASVLGQMHVRSTMQRLEEDVLPGGLVKVPRPAREPALESE